MRPARPLPAVRSMSPDEEKDVFEYGDRTIFQLRSQSFMVDGEYGTLVHVAPAPAKDDIPQIVPTASDREDRLEQKLDAALQMIERMQQKLESLDATVERSLRR